MKGGELTLYWNIISPYSRAVKNLIDIGNIPCKLVSVDLLKGEQRNPEFMKLNPKAQVPVLVLKDSTVITESIAIMVYLCEKFPETLSSYYGTTPKEKAKVIQILSWAQYSFSQNVGFLWAVRRDYSMKYSKPIPHEKIVIGQKKLGRGLSDLDSLIGEDKRYLVGTSPTIADLIVYSLLTLVVYVGKAHSQYSNINRWFANIYAIGEVKTMTHQWYPIAQQIGKFIKEAPVLKAAL